jgi:hypothetical protein
VAQHDGDAGSHGAAEHADHEAQQIAWTHARSFENLQYERETAQESAWTDVMALAAAAASVLDRIGALETKLYNEVLNLDAAAFTDEIEFTDEERHVLTELAAAIFLTEPRASGNSYVARTARTSDELADTWIHVFRERLQFEADPTQPIYDSQVIAKMWTQWMWKWLNTSLRPDQQRKRDSQKTSIFGAYVRKTYGNKSFVLALMQTGVTWAPPLDLVRQDHAAASKHIRTHFVAWVRNVLDAMVRHRTDPQTVAAKRRSGGVKDTSGLTDAEKLARQKRDDAESNYAWAVFIAEQLGERDPYGKGKTRGKGREHHNTRNWNDLSVGEQWWVHQLRNGSLREELLAAQTAHGGWVQAPRFEMPHMKGKGRAGKGKNKW